MVKKILIVDDDSGFVKDIISAHYGKKYSFAFADSLTRAKRILNNENFDLILANVKIPGGSSLELKKELKQYSHKTMIVFMSSIDADYRFVRDCGENCCYKYEINNSLGSYLEKN